MSEEEKKAIEELRQIRESYIRADECGLSNNDFKGEIETLSIILNLIEKQQAQIEKKENIIYEMAKELEDETTMERYCDREDCYADEYIDGHCQKCLNCIIKYFTNKVEEKINESKDNN